VLVKSFGRYVAIFYDNGLCCGFADNQGGGFV
jgi:hypothetical protein